MEQVVLLWLPFRLLVLCCLPVTMATGEGRQRRKTCIQLWKRTSNGHFAFMELEWTMRIDE